MDNTINNNRVIKRGDIYWYEYSGAYTSEQDGLRPCLVVSNDKANEYSPVITVVPLTMKKKKALPTHATVITPRGESVVLCEQVYTISKDRLGYYIGTTSTTEMFYVSKALRTQLDL